MKQSAKTKNLQTTLGAVDPRFARVIEAFVQDRRVSQTKMFGSVGLKMGGKVFAIFYKGKFVAKLPGSASTPSSLRAKATTSIRATGGRRRNGWPFPGKVRPGPALPRKRTDS